jgi:hypothetical protein
MQAMYLLARAVMTVSMQALLLPSFRQHFLQYMNCDGYECL